MRGRIGGRAAVLAVLAVAGGLVASPGGAVEGGAVEEHRHEVVLRHGRFEPAEVEVGVGESVTWTNQDDDDPQSVTADDGSFDSHPQCSEAESGQCMKAGDTFTHTFRAEGRFPYYSRTEGGPGGSGMSGVVTVVADGHDRG